MKKKNIMCICLLVLLGVTLSCYLHYPKSIDDALTKMSYDFEIGEIVDTQKIDENLTAVLLTNNAKNAFQTAIVEKNGIFYRGIGITSSMDLSELNELDNSNLRTQGSISWYDESDNCVVFGVVYDEEVSSIKISNRELDELSVNNYRLFYGVGSGRDSGVYDLFDENGNQLQNLIG